MNHKALVVAAALVSLLAGVPASVGAELPKAAAKLKSDELRAIYSGKTANWSVSQAFFAPDGSAKLVTRDRSAYGDGEWSVSGNRVCLKLKFTSVSSSKTGKSTMCWDWYKDGKKYWTLYSKRFDKTRPTKKDYYQEEIRKLTSGDSVSAKHSALAKGR